MLDIKCIIKAIAIKFGAGGGSNFNNSSQPSSSSAPSSNKPEVVFHANYLGGHKAYPIRKAMDVKIIVFPDRIEIEKLFLTIPFSKMYNIENMDDKKISALRVVVLGLIFIQLLNIMMELIINKWFLILIKMLKQCNL